MNTIKSITLIGRRWFDSFGNTYHTVEIIVDGVRLIKTALAYGYGDHYIQTAQEWLHGNKLAPAVGTPLWQHCRDNEIELCTSVIDVQRKRDV